MRRQEWPGGNGNCEISSAKCKPYFAKMMTDNDIYDFILLLIGRLSVNTDKK